MDSNMTGLPFLHGNGLESLPLFLTSLAIGLLIGLERERSPAARAGLRTFALVALFGTLSAMLSARTDAPWVLAGGLLIVGLMIIAAYFTLPTEERDPGTTTEAALLVCYSLGAMVWYGYSTLAIMLAIVTTSLLYFKPELHGMTQRLTRRDLLSVLQFAVLSFVILPILPDQEYGPYHAFNPHQAWLMVVLISGLSLAGYVALRIVGQRYGAPLLGFFGGLVSSTATTLVYARYSKTAEGLAQLAVMVILIANLVVLVRLAVLGAVVSPASLPQLLPVLGSGLLFGLAGIAYWWRRLQRGEELPVPEITNPTEIRTAVGFGLLYAAMLLGSAWLSDLAGSRGLYALALASGLADVDAITLSSLRLFELGTLKAGQAVTAIALAVLVNLASKLGLVFFIGGARLGRRFAPGMVAMGAGLGLRLLTL